jgi:hypothetical protein
MSQQASGLRLRDLIEFDQETMKPALEQHGADADKPARLGHRVSGFVSKAGADKLNAAMDADVFEVLLKSVQKLQSLKEYTDVQKHPASETSVVTLGDTKFSTKYQPILGIAASGLKLPELRFTLEVELALKSMALSITDGIIRSIAPGEAHATARLKYGSVLLKEVPSRHVTLPGEIDLGDGIAIPR